MLNVPTDSVVLSGLSDLIAAKLGLSFPPERWRDLERALQPVAAEMGFASLEALARWLQTATLTPPELEALASSLTVGETYFFREPQAFEALREHVVPELLAARPGSAPPLRIWSAGCCSGEEAYSLAMFFDRLGRAGRDLRVSILATDINPHFLRKARAGIYRGWSFRGAPDWLQRDYFIAREGDSFELRPEIRRMVEFEPLNLALDTFPSLHNRTNGLDLIFCRNVLMYFSPAHVERAIAGFHRSLVNDGYLVVSVCEASSNLCPQFQPRAFPGVTFYRKTARPITRPAATFGPLPDAWPAAFSEDAAPLADAPEPIAPFAEPEPPAAAVDAAAVARAELKSAESLYREGNYSEAAGRLEALLARGPFAIEAATLLGRAYANQGNLTEARHWIERALFADKLRAPLHYLRASILQEQGERALATAALEKVLYLDPDFVLAHLALADLADRAGRAEKATRHRTVALRSLRRHPANEVIPESEGLTAERLIAMIEALQSAAAAS